MQTIVISETLRSPSRTFRNYLIVVTVLGAALMTAPIVLGVPAEPFILLTVLGPLLGGALLVARRTGVGVRTLLRDAFRWRIGWRNWALVLFAVPMATVAVAAISGSLMAPARSWVSTFTTYLISVLVGTLVINLWEELAWQGVVQRHLTARFGWVRGALLTALPFAAIHLPLSYSSGATGKEALMSAGFVVLMAPPFRLLMGHIDRITGGSLLAVGVLHASFNASGSFDVLEGGWQHMAAVTVIAVIVGLHARRRNPSIAEGIRVKETDMTHATREHSSPSTSQLRPIPQYSVGRIFAVWAAAALPMGILSWVVAPRLAELLDGPAPLVQSLLIVLCIGLVWQFVLVMLLVGREQGSLRWSVLREALWLRSPRSPRSGRVGGRVWLVLIPLMVLFWAGDFIPDLAHPVGRDFGAFLGSDAGAAFFEGAWGWFAVMVVLWLFNTVLGEELLFRGFLLPRMNGAFGRADWLVNGVLFAVYHLHIPWAIPGILLDAFALAYPTKRYRSALIGIAVHSAQTVFLAVMVLGLVL